MERLIHILSTDEFLIPKGSSDSIYFKIHRVQWLTVEETDIGYFSNGVILPRDLSEEEKSISIHQFIVDYTMDLQSFRLVCELTVFRHQLYVSILYDNGFFGQLSNKIRIFLLIKFLSHPSIRLELLLNSSLLDVLEEDICFAEET
jgi:hypothetical protein